MAKSRGRRRRSGFFSGRSRSFAQNAAVASTQAPSELTIPQSTRLQSGARSGALLAVASGVAIVANYIFLLAAGRLLGSDRYGSLAALLGLLAVVLIPAQALQMAVSREVSRRIASGDSASAYAFARRTLRLALIATGPLVVLAFGLIRAPLADSSRESRIDLRPFLRYLAPVAVGLVGIALLTHIDLLIVKAHFTGGEAGAAASRDGRGCAESVGRPTVRAVSRAKVPSRPVTG